MRKSHNILQINVCINVLSTGRITEQIGQKILEQGWVSNVLTYGPSKKSQSHVIKVVGTFERLIHRVINRFLDAQGYGSYFATKRAIKKIKEINPDIIHLHNIHDCWLNHKLLFDYLRNSKKSVVWTFHDCWAFTGHCSYFDDVDCMRWKSGCYECPLQNKNSLDLSNYNYKRKKKLFCGLNNMVVIPVSYWLEKLTKQSFMGNLKTITIHNGIDLTMFRPRGFDLRHKLNIKDSFVLLGVASSWGKSKGIFDFVKLSKDSNYVVILIGISKTLKKELPNNIICIEKTDSQEQLAEYYSMADVFVNPTYHDNYPTVNLEALACGTPMVGYDSGGSPEALYVEKDGHFVIDSKCGVIVDKGDFDALHKAIEMFRLEDDETRQARRVACRKHAEMYFDKEVCYNRYIDIYSILLQKTIDE